MSGAATPGFGREIALEGAGVAAFWLGGRAVFVTGEAQAAFVSISGAVEQSIRDLHEGALLCAIHGPGESVFTGGDDGRVMRVSAEGAAEQAAVFPGQWVEALAYSPGLHILAAAIGKHAALVKGGAEFHRFAHDSALTDLAFEPNGRRLAAAHYGGVTISWASNPQSRRKTLSWTGAHQSVAWSPDARFVITAMQENALHGWRLQDGAHFRMPGYPTKIRAMAFTHDSAWLATAGAPALVCWPFAGSAAGPMNREALIAAELDAPVTALAPHPAQPLIAVGTEEGAVALCALGANAAPRPAQISDGGARIVSLAWRSDGRALAALDLAGRALVFDFAAFA